LLSLVHQLAPQKPVTIADIGCGYGAMLAFINKTPAYSQTIYHGVDINRAMIAACHQAFPAKNALFTIGNAPPNWWIFACFPALST
jgi:trans-aconitate methyltransferase